MSEPDVCYMEIATGYKGHEFGGQTYWIVSEANGPASRVITALEEAFQRGLNVAKKELEKHTEAQDDGKGVVAQSGADGKNDSGSGDHVGEPDSPDSVEG